MTNGGKCKAIHAEIVKIFLTTEKAPVLYQFKSICNVKEL